MSKNILYLIPIFLIFIVSIYLLTSKTKNTEKNVKINLKETPYELEVAKTIAQKSKGLMNRTTLCQNCGMIFINDRDTPQSFWMKNTLIPLDMIFINSAGIVINIESAFPESNTPDYRLKIYKSASPAKYVIELNSGESQKIGLAPGDFIKIDQNL